MRKALSGELFCPCDRSCFSSFDQVPSQFVENMLDIHGKYTELIASVFRNDQQFVGALDKVRKVSGGVSDKMRLMIIQK